MAENSGFWTTGGATGDQQASYSQADLADFVRAIGEGVVLEHPVLNDLECSDGGANTVDVATGAALVDGKWYINTSVQNINIPSASGAGNTRIDLLVLRADWANFNVSIFRIAGTDASSPVAPTPTQTTETTYDIVLCEVLVDVSGSVTVTDKREFLNSYPDETTIENVEGILQLKDDGVTADKIGADAVDGTKIADDAIGSEHIEDDAVDSQHIQAGAIDLEHMSANSVDSNQYVDGSIDTAHIGNLQVTGAKIATGTITPAKTDFFDNDHIYSGRVDEDGNAEELPSGWTCSRVATGTYRIAHNLGTTNYTIIVVGYYHTTIKTIAANYCDIYTSVADGTLANGYIHFVLVKD
jgi:hypothetical protein